MKLDLEFTGDKSCGGFPRGSEGGLCETPIHTDTNPYVLHIVNPLCPKEEWYEDLDTGEVVPYVIFHLGCAP